MGPPVRVTPPSVLQSPSPVVTVDVLALGMDVVRRTTVLET